jgi:hypothetical protein
MLQDLVQRHGTENLGVQSAEAVQIGGTTERGHSTHR